MTAFNTADLPVTINTVEKLHVWSATVLNNMYPDQTNPETVNSTPRAVTVNAFESTVANPPQWVHVARSSLKLLRAWQKSGKVWEHVIDVGTDVIPNEFKA